MAENKEKRDRVLVLISQRLLAISSRLAAFLATQMSRLLIVIVFVGLALYLAYGRAWRPISETAPWPPGVSEASPKLNTDPLQTIKSQRVERTEAVGRQFQVGSLLQPPPQL